VPLAVFIVRVLSSFASLLHTCRRSGSSKNMSACRRELLLGSLPTLDEHGPYFCLWVT
jgi:hypothetical protein